MLAAVQFKICKNVMIKICEIIILNVLCGCKTWSFVLIEEHRLRMLEIKVFRGTLREKKNKIRGG
jgi:hypothetical protein